MESRTWIIGTSRYFFPVKSFLCSADVLFTSPSTGLIILCESGKEGDMVRKLLLFMVLAIGLLGCSTSPQLLNADHPGKYSFANGDLQLFFSNPDYSSDEPWARQQYIEDQLFGRKSGFPAVTGGIGMMEVWRF